MTRLTLLLATLAGVIRPLTAQPDASEHHAILRVALAAYAEQYANRPAELGGGRQLFLDPVGAPSRYTSSYLSLPNRESVPRSDSVVRALAAELRAKIATDTQLVRCTGLPSMCPPPQMDFAVILVGDPVVSRDTATVSVRVAATIMAPRRGTPTRVAGGEGWIVRLLRDGSSWRVESISALCVVTRCGRAGFATP